MKNLQTTLYYDCSSQFQSIFEIKPKLYDFCGQSAGCIALYTMFEHSIDVNQAQQNSRLGSWEMYGFR